TASFSAERIDAASLIIAATDNQQVNLAVYQAAKARNVLVNVADQPEMCDFILPSVLDRSPIVVAISSGGQSPILARQLRARLETMIPPAYSKLGQLAGQYRQRV